MLAFVPITTPVDHTVIFDIAQPIGWGEFKMISPVRPKITPKEIAELILKYADDPEVRFTLDCDGVCNHIVAWKPLSPFLQPSSQQQLEQA